MTPDFVDVFRGGRFLSEDGALTIVVRKAGALIVRSGRVMVCDPFVPIEEPLARKVPNGAFPVELAIASSKNDQRVAAALVRFAKRDAAAWKLATRRGQDPKKLGPGEAFGYGVDTGTGCFVDARAARSLEAVSDALMKVIRKTYVPTWSWANVECGDANVVAFSTGWGDGVYPSYWGFDSRGALVALATDFHFLTTRKVESVVLPAEGPFEHELLEAAGVKVTRVRGEALTFRVRGGADLRLMTSAGRPIRASTTITYRGGVRTETFKPSWRSQRPSPKATKPTSPKATKPTSPKATKPTRGAPKDVLLEITVMTGEEVPLPRVR